MDSAQVLKRNSVVVRIVLAFLIAVVADYAIQAVPFSFRKLLIDSAVLTGPELGTLEIIVGFLNSIIVTGVCLAFLKRPVIHIAATAAVAQILWIEWMYGFQQGGETWSTAILRYMEHVGVALGAGAVAFLSLHLQRKNKVASV